MNDNIWGKRITGDLTKRKVVTLPIPPTEVRGADGEVIVHTTVRLP